MVATYTYVLNIGLTRHGKEHLYYEPALSDPSSNQYKQLLKVVHDGIDRAVMQSDLRDIYHGIKISSFNETSNGGVSTEFYLQLSDNTDDKKLVDAFKQYLKMSRNSLGGTDLIADEILNEELSASGYLLIYIL